VEKPEESKEQGEIPDKNQLEEKGPGKTLVEEPKEEPELEGPKESNNEIKEETKEAQQEHQTKEEESEENKILSFIINFEKELTEKFILNPAEDLSQQVKEQIKSLQQRLECTDFSGAVEPVRFKISVELKDETLVKMVLLIYTIHQAKLKRVLEGKYQFLPPKRDPMPVEITFSKKTFLVFYNFNGRGTQFGNCVGMEKSKKVISFEAGVENWIGKICSHSKCRDKDWINKDCSEKRSSEFDFEILQAIEISRRKAIAVRPGRDAEYEEFASINVFVACIMYKKLFEKLKTEEEKKEFFRRYWCKDTGDLHIFTGDLRQANFDQLLEEYKTGFDIISAIDLEKSLRGHAQVIFEPSASKPLVPKLSELPAQEIIIPSVPIAQGEGLKSPVHNLFALPIQKHAEPSLGIAQVKDPSTNKQEVKNKNEAQTKGAH